MPLRGTTKDGNPRFARPIEAISRVATQIRAYFIIEEDTREFLSALALRQTKEPRQTPKSGMSDRGLSIVMICRDVRLRRIESNL